MSYLVQVVGPYDTAYVGPFQTRVEAEKWKSDMVLCIGPDRRHVFDFYVIDNEKAKDAINRWGVGELLNHPVSFCGPIEWEHDNVLQ